MASGTRGRFHRVLDYVFERTSSTPFKLLSPLHGDPDELAGAPALLPGPLQTPEPLQGFIQMRKYKTLFRQY